MAEGRDEKGRFAEGNKISPGRTPAKREWLEIFKENFIEQDYQFAIEVLKDAILKEKPWALKLIFDKTLPNKTEVSGNINNPLYSPDIIQKLLDKNG